MRTRPLLRASLLLLCILAMTYKAFAADTMLPPREQLAADLNGDGLVNGADLSVLMSQWSKPGAVPATPKPPAPPLAVHKSQELLDGPGWFVEISQRRFVTAANPRGWKPPEGAKVAARGWMALLPDVLTARDAGYTSVWLWEPTGQSPPGAEVGGCMAYAGKATAADGWTPAMLDDFDDFCRISGELGMKIIVYSGCAQHINVGTTLNPRLRATTRADIPRMVDDAEWFAEQGVDGIGFDAASLWQERDPQAFVDFAYAIRANPATSELLLACEGWPFKGDNRLQAQVQQQFVSVDLLSNGSSVSDAKFAEFLKRVDLGAEHSRVPGRRGAWLIHGANWTGDELRKAYQLCNAYGVQVIDWRIPGPYQD